MAGAIVWVIGLPIVAFAGVIPSDAEYFWMGISDALVGVAVAPVALAYAGASQASLRKLTRALGLLVSLALILTGALLVLGVRGYLGDAAPSWITSAAWLALTALFAWILLATFFARSSTAIGRSVFWLGMLAGASFLASIAVSALIFLLDRSFIVTKATVPLVTLSFLLNWLCLPAWLIALAVRVR